MKPTVPGMPARPSIASVIAQPSSGERRPKPREAADAVVTGLGLLALHDGERGDVHEQVGDQVQNGRGDTELGGDDDSGEHVPGLRDTGVTEQPLERRLTERADVADRIVTVASAASSGAHVVCSEISGDVEEAQEYGERGGLGGGRHERGDRRRRSLVDVWRPLVERCDRGLEGESDDDQRDAAQQQRVADQGRACGTGQRSRDRR